MNWGDLRIFLEVVRTRSFSLAAGQLGIDQSTVSRRVSGLETTLGNRLIERRPLGHSLTKAGAELLRSAEAMETTAEAVERRVTGIDQRLSGELRIASVDMRVEHLLVPVLQRFAERHPAISLSLVTALTPADLAKREAEVPIRVSKVPPETLVGRRLCDFGLAAYAAPEFCARHPASLGPAEIDWIGWESPAQEARLITQAYLTARIRHRADGFLALRALVKAGLAASVLPCYWADRDPLLRRLYPERAPIGDQEFWLLSHPDLRQSARVRAFLDVARAALPAERKNFEGRSASTRERPADQKLFRP